MFLVQLYELPLYGCFGTTLGNTSLMELEMLDGYFSQYLMII